MSNDNTTLTDYVRQQAQYEVNHGMGHANTNNWDTGLKQTYEAERTSAEKKSAESKKP